MQPSFDLMTVSHKKQKERITKTTLMARETFEYIAILLCSFFVYLFSGFCWVEKRRETDAYARFAGAYQRLLSLNHQTRNMRRQNAPLLSQRIKLHNTVLQIERTKAKHFPLWFSNLTCVPYRKLHISLLFLVHVTWPTLYLLLWNVLLSDLLWEVHPL